MARSYSPIISRFSYLKSHGKSKIILDPQNNDFEREFVDYEWQDFYGKVEEEVPEISPEDRGGLLFMTHFVDADHAGDKMIRCSYSGILIYINRDPIIWYSEKQNNIQSSNFRSEIVALRSGLEITKGLRCNISMAEVPIDGSTLVVCDNNSVVTSTSIPQSTLGKNHLGICYGELK